MAGDASEALLVCPVCGVEFKPKAGVYGQRYCSVRCRKKANNRRYGARLKKGVQKPKEHRCVDCGRLTPDHRCPECLARWREAHGVEVDPPAYDYWGLYDK